ncbi:uncharacterized protein LOC143299035 [Babylonia areolata]|uniref:uncharacterized protein LOC143299035 n=1 Tax=Babylonia areolata TaxID=304850 RepID=UPI003FD1DBC1
MATSSTLPTTTLSLSLLLLVTSAPCCQAWSRDIKVRYYSSVTLTCLPPNTNTTTFPDPSTTQVFWMTPDATVLTESTPVEQFPRNVRLVNDSVIGMLRVSQVDDGTFGYYTCVMVKVKADDSNNTDNNKVWLVRWGLNVNGADFSQLEAQYRKNAVVGAIAAGVMIVLLGGACLLWHFRYSKRAARGGGGGGGGEGEGGDGADDVEKEKMKMKMQTGASVFHNRGYDDDGDDDDALQSRSGAEGGESAAAATGTAVEIEENGVKGDSYRM